MSFLSPKDIPTPQYGTKNDYISIGNNEDDDGRCGHEGLVARPRVIFRRLVSTGVATLRLSVFRLFSKNTENIFSVTAESTSLNCLFF